MHLVWLKSGGGRFKVGGVKVVHLVGRAGITFRGIYSHLVSLLPLVAPH